MINNTVSEGKKAFMEKRDFRRDRLGQAKHPNNPCPAVERMERVNKKRKKKVIAQ